MHELSIANSMVKLATKTAQANNINKIKTIHVRLGVLSGVVKESLEFCFDVVTAGTIAEGATLVIKEVALKIFCSQCEKERILVEPIPLKCPECKMRTNDIVEGREIELYSIESGDE